MTDLQTLPGIGSGLAAELRAVGIPDAEALRTVGAPAAADRLAELGMRDATRTARILAEALGGLVAAAAVRVLGIDCVVFTVGDLDAALAHYERGLGLPVVNRGADPPTALLRLGAGTPGLSLREDASLPSGPASRAAPQCWLRVADVDAAVRGLRGAGLTVGEPVDLDSGRAVEVADRWGNVVRFIARR